MRLDRSRGFKLAKIVLLSLTSNAVPLQDRHHVILLEYLFPSKAVSRSTPFLWAVRRERHPDTCPAANPTRNQLYIFRHSTRVVQATVPETMCDLFPGETTDPARGQSEIPTFVWSQREADVKPRSTRRERANCEDRLAVSVVSARNTILIPIHALICLNSKVTWRETRDTHPASERASVPASQPAS